MKCNALAGPAKLNQEVLRNMALHAHLFFSLQAGLQRLKYTLDPSYFHKLFFDIFAYSDDYEVFDWLTYEYEDWARLNKAQVSERIFYLESLHPKGGSYKNCEHCGQVQGPNWPAGIRPL